MYTCADPVCGNNKVEGDEECEISYADKSGKYQNHNPIRERKLLLNKSEIIKVGDKIAQKGMTLIPLNIYTTKTGLIKVKVGLCKGKKLYDKRQSLKEKDIKRDLERGI